MKYLDDSIARYWEVGRDLYHNVLIVVPLRFVEFKQAQPGNRRDSIAVTLIVASIYRNKIVQVFEVGESHGRCNLGHFSIRSWIDHIVVTRKPKVAHEPHLLGQSIVVRYDRAAFVGIEEFCRMKTEDLALAESAEELAIQTASKAVRCVEHQAQIVFA